jgi:hypothetical protein
VKSISHFVWQHVFTFNVDDVIDDCYSIPNSQQNTKPATYLENYFRPADLRDLPVVYLHGYVGRPQDGFVFSAEQYGTSIAQDSRWFRILADVLTSYPVIVVGCSLNEPDVFYHLKHRTGIDAGLQTIPSLFVSRDMDPVKEAMCKKFGLIPVIATADEFFTELLKLTPKVPSPLDLVRPAKTDIFEAAPPAADQRVFFRQWLFVDIEKLPVLAGSTETEPNLLMGLEPQWAQIRRGDDVPRAIIEKIVKDAVEWHGTGAGTTLRHLGSGAGEGKTVALMRVALELSKLGYRVFYFNSYERISTKETLVSVNSVGRPVILCVDRLGEHGTQVAELLEGLRANETKCLILTADRQQRHRRITDVIDPILMEELQLPKLSKPEGEVLLDRLRTNGLLGKNTNKKNAELLPQISGKELFTSIIHLNSGAKQLPAVVASELKDLSPGAKRVYSVVALAHHCGYPIKSAVLIRAAQVPTSDVFRMIYGGELNGVITRLPPNGEYYQCRHQIVATEVVHQYPKHDLLQIAIELAKALAPYVNTKTYSRGTEEARLAAKLMDYDSTLEGLVGASLADVFYKSVKSAWDWNNRYWNQLALLKLETDPVVALQYAETSVSIERHFVALTTLAKVLFKLARSSAGTGPGAAYLRRALEATDGALKSGSHIKRANLQAFDVGIRGTILYFDTEGAGQPDSGTISKLGDYLHASKAVFIAEEQKRLELRWQDHVSGKVRPVRAASTRPAPRPGRRR